MLFGTDSHTCMAGAFNEFATGIGNTDAGFVLGRTNFSAFPGSCCFKCSRSSSSIFRRTSSVKTPVRRRRREPEFVSWFYFLWCDASAQKRETPFEDLHDQRSFDALHHAEHGIPGVECFQLSVPAAQGVAQLAITSATPRAIFNGCESAGHGGDFKQADIVKASHCRPEKP